jgi:acetyl esterase/lipase
MLGLKVVLSQGSPVPTLVFDEVDSGIGGATAAAVGERLARVATTVQVLVVTHSPQVAARATAQVGDIAAAHGGDPARLGVLGHSAGAHLALMIALDRRYMAAVERPGLIRAAAGLAGPYEFLPFNVASSINAFGRAPDPTLTQPVTFARADAPPIWLGHGTADVVVHAEDTEILRDRLTAVGAPVEARLYPGLDHADLISTFSPLFRNKAPVLGEVSDFFRRRLGQG